MINKATVNTTSIHRDVFIVFDVFLPFVLFAVMNACASNPCRHDGRCSLNPSGSYHCHCQPLYQGDCCQTSRCLFN